MFEGLHKQATVDHQQKSKHEKTDESQPHNNLNSSRQFQIKDQASDTRPRWFQPRSSTAPALELQKKAEADGILFIYLQTTIAV